MNQSFKPYFCFWHNKEDKQEAEQVERCEHTEEALKLKRRAHNEWSELDGNCTKYKVR